MYVQHNYSIYFALPQFYSIFCNLAFILLRSTLCFNQKGQTDCNGLYGINSPTYKLQLTAVQEHINCNSGLNVRPENIVITACTNVRTHTNER